MSVKQVTGGVALVVAALQLVACDEGHGGTEREDAFVELSDAGLLDGSADDVLTPLDAPAPPTPDVYVIDGAPAIVDTGGDAPPPTCSGAGDDRDSDGFTVAAGDCDDCNPYVNPRASDAPGNGLDEDCSGKADDEASSCETGLAAEANDPEEAARALGLCRKSSGNSWGLVRAAWVYPDGTNSSLAKLLCPSGLPPSELSHSVLGAFGPNVMARHGPSMLVLSTGIARPGVIEVPASAAPAYGTSPNNALMCRFSKAPDGFPRDAPSCTGVPTSTDRTATDGMALELTLVVPSNAVGLSFDFDFYSTEFPNYVCSEKNDHFVALLSSKHPKTPADKNISFDSRGSVVNVNSGFMAVCRPATINGRTFACPRGEAELKGTGMDLELQNQDNEPYLQGGATGWLRTNAPVVPGETIVLRLAIWDTADSAWDSTVLLDNFTWLLKDQPKVVPPTVPVTEPILL
jgi:Putative metal-binding motif